MLSRRKRVLLVGEGVTLAHVTRPYLLAKSLDPERYEAILAIPNAYLGLLKPDGLHTEPLTTIPPERFLRALASGSPLYDYPTLSHYLADDLALIERLRPDLIVGDFRLSLAVSGPLARIPYAALTNAHWSPHATMRHLPIPEHVSTRLLGVGMSQFFFNLFSPLILAAHARSLNRLRRKHGLPALGGLREAYTHGDYTLYMDTPGLIPTRSLPERHRYLGPAIWSPEMPLPEWWEELERDRPLVYLTMGSSGQVSALAAILDGLRPLAVNILVATAGRQIPDLVQGDGRCWAADYLPGSAVAARADLVICNGGSATVYQALAAGRPVLGIPSNLDQHLTMAHVVRAKAGLSLRAECVKASDVATAIRALLTKNQYRENAARIAEEFRGYDCAERFRIWLDTLFN